MKVDTFLKELILYLYYFKGLSVREIASEIEKRTNIEITHTAVHKVLKRARLEINQEMLDFIRELEKQMKPLNFDYSDLENFANNQNLNAIQLKINELESLLNIEDIQTVIYDSNTKSLTILYKSKKSKTK